LVADVDGWVAGTVDEPVEAVYGDYGAVILERIPCFVAGVEGRRAGAV